MKYISFVVPCFNSEEYMEKCIDSLLIGKKDVEIIIVNDGSTDKTGLIADKYKKKYPSIVKVVHKENGGHGSGINVGLEMATGKYFKVVDSDDWVDEEAYKKVLKYAKKSDADLIVTNYVYSYTDGRTNQVMNFKNIFRDGEVISWDETKRFKTTQYLSLHSMMYKKSVLDEANIKLPENIFYEDNLFIYLPMPYTKNVLYIDADFYRYFIGRPDQSIQEPQLIKRAHHQVIVSREAAIKYDLDEVKSKKLRSIMKRELIFLMTIAVVFTRLGKSKECEDAYKKLWDDVLKGNPKLYKSIRHFSMCGLVSMPGALGRAIGVNGYKFAHKLVKFN